MADKNCPHRIFQGDDLMRVLTGDYYCTAPSRGREIGEYGEEQDYFKCDSENHENCSWYLKQRKLQEENNTRLLKNLLFSKP